MVKMLYFIYVFYNFKKISRKEEFQHRLVWRNLGLSSLFLRSSLSTQEQSRVPSHPTGLYTPLSSSTWVPNTVFNRIHF